jgi:hypothetical protein
MQPAYVPSSVAEWTHHAGLDKYGGLTQHLEKLASSRFDLAFLTDEDWQHTLSPLQLKLGKRRRVEAAIRELRVQTGAPTKQTDEAAELDELRRMFSTPGGRGAMGGGAMPTAFSPSREFMGPRQGYLFKNGPHGMGYYRDAGTTPEPPPHASPPHGLPPHGSPPHGASPQSLTSGQIQQQIQQQQQRRLMQQQMQQQRQQMMQYKHEHEHAIRSQHRQPQQQVQRTPPQREPPSPRTVARAAAHARLMARPF